MKSEVPNTVHLTNHKISKMERVLSHMPVDHCFDYFVSCAIRMIKYALLNSMINKQYCYIHQNLEQNYKTNVNNDQKG